MLKLQFSHIINYLKRNKLTGFVNLFGLSTGFTFFILLALYVKYETSFDNFYHDAKTTYRLTIKSTPSDGEPWTGRSLPPPLKAQIEARLPEVESIARLYQSSEEVFQYDDQVFEEENTYFADQEIINMFDLELISKNKEKPLEAPSSVIISQSVANKYFGINNPLGKIVKLPWGDLEITAIYKDLPGNMHVRPVIIISFDSPWWIKLYNEENWDLFFLRYYLKVKSGSNPGLVAQNITAILEEVKAPDQANSKQIVELQAIKDIHLGGKIPDEPNTREMRIIRALEGIALFILIIVLINYINLASAQVLDRSSQVSIRKVLGISKFGIIKNFALESGLLQAAALAIAFCAVILIIPQVNNLLGCKLSLKIFSLTEWLMFGSVVITTVTISVIYPVLIMFTFKPVSCLKGYHLPAYQNTWIRKGLIGFQFFISFVLIFGTLIFYKQSKYLINKDIGINTRNMLVIRTSHANWNSFPVKKELFKEEMKASQPTVSITNSNAIPGFPSFIDWISTTSDGEKKTAYFSLFDTDYDFVKTMGLKIIAGRELSREYGTDINSAIITRKGLNDLGYQTPDEALGKEVLRDFTQQTYTIVGVADNFSLMNTGRTSYPPFISILENQNRFLCLRYNGNNDRELVNITREKWKIAFGDLPFRYFFLDENYKAIYSNEVFQTKIILLFSILAVILAAMGLFGIAYFTIVKREKEFSIRKVNGAVVRDVFILVSKGFIKLIAVSSLLAIPLTWWLSLRWLGNYSNRIEITWWYCLIPFCLLGMVTLITISYHTFKTARVNPVRLLRHE